MEEEEARPEREKRVPGAARPRRSQDRPGEAEREELLDRHVAVRLRVDDGAVVERVEGEREDRGARPEAPVRRSREESRQRERGEERGEPEGESAVAQHRDERHGDRLGDRAELRLVAVREEVV